MPAAPQFSILSEPPVGLVFPKGPSRPAVLRRARLGDSFLFLYIFDAPRMTSNSWLTLPNLRMLLIVFKAAANAN